MLVCHCRGVSDREIKRLVREGASSTREIARATGAGMNCGGCRSNVRQVMNRAMARECKRREAGTTFLDLSVPVES